MDGWLSQTRLIPDGDNIDLYDEDDAGQKEAMVPSIVSFLPLFFRTSILDDDDADQKRD